MKRLFSRFGSVALWLCPFWAVAQDCHVALRGLITDADSGVPLVGATVRIQRPALITTSDAHGYYQVPNLCEGTTYVIEVEHASCTHLTQTVRLRDGQEIDFHLHHRVLDAVLVRERAAVLAAVEAASQTTARDIESAKGVHLGEALRRLPGVTLLQTGATIAKPIVQGLHSNRVAIVQQNVALEGQQWGADHAPEIDPFAANVFKVVKGAAGVRYGAAGIGGAIVLEPAPLPQTVGLGGWIATQGASNGRGVTVAGALEGKLAKSGIAFRLQTSAKRAGNLRAPLYWLHNTGLAGLNGQLALGWQNDRWQHRATFSRFGQKSGVLRAAHFGNTTDLLLAIASDTPRNNQNVFRYTIDRPYQWAQHYTAQYEANVRLGDKWKMLGRYTFQYNYRREYDVVRSSANDRPQISFRLGTHQAELVAQHYPLRHWQGETGVQGAMQDNSVGRGGYIPNFRTVSGSLWWIERWRRYPTPWEIEFGARLDARQPHIAYAAGTFLPAGQARDTVMRFVTNAATAGLLYHFSRHKRIGLQTGWAVRPPHVYELFARGVHFATAAYEEGNRALLPERAWNTQLHGQWATKRGIAHATVYANRMERFIFLQPRGNTVLTVRGALQAFDYTQTTALLYGTDGSATMRLAGNWYAEAQYALVRGRNLAAPLVSDTLVAAGRWLPLLPSDRVSYGLRWSPTPESATFARVQGSTTWRQTRFAPAEVRYQSMPAGFTLWQIEGAHAFKWLNKQWEVGATIQNLTNRRYRENTDFFRFFADAPGFNLLLRAKVLL